MLTTKLHRLISPFKDFGYVFDDINQNNISHVGVIKNISTIPLFSWMFNVCAYWISYSYLTLQWRHDERDSVSNHQPHDCLFNCLCRRRSKKTSKLRVTGLCVWNSPGTGEFPAQMASNAENVSIWWRHHEMFRIRLAAAASNMNVIEKI